PLPVWSCFYVVPFEQIRRHLVPQLDFPSILSRVTKWEESSPAIARICPVVKPIEYFLHPLDYASADGSAVDSVGISVKLQIVHEPPKPLDLAPSRLEGSHLGERYQHLEHAAPEVSE